MIRSACRRFAAISSLILLLTSAAFAAQPDSDWLRAEQTRFTRLLSQRPADVLIVPFQVAGSGFDPVERMLMATQLADSLSAGTRLAIADPVLVGRALGEGLRTHDEARMRMLARQMGARFLVIGSAGHDRRSAFQVEIRVLKHSDAGEWQELGRKSWPSLALDDERPPYQNIPALAPAVADMLLSKMAATRPAQSSANPPGSLPSLQEALASPNSPNVHVVQLLAILHPRTPEAGVSRAWIESLRRAQTATAGPGQRLALARALSQLGRRPAAIAALGPPRSEAEQALRAVLDGNLPEAEQFALKITDPVLRLIAQVEIRDLREAYLSPDPSAAAVTLKALQAQGSDWLPFLAGRLQDEANPWDAPDLSSTVRRFHGLLKLEDLGNDALKAVLEIPSDTPMDIRMARQALVAYDNQLGSLPAGKASAFRAMLLDLLQVEVVAGMLGDGYLTIDFKDLPDAGRKLLKEQDSILSGHPDFEAMRANVAWREYARWRGKQRAQWQTEALARTRAAYALSGWATSAIHNAERRADWKADIANELQGMRVESFWTWPVQAGHLTHAVLEDPAALRWYADRAVKYATTEFSMLAWLRDHDLLLDRKAAIEQTFAGRFNGSADFADQRSADLLAADDVAGAEAILKRYVDARLAAFEPYREYLDLLVSQGRHAEGYKMILGYPGFAPDSSVNVVGSSNYANLAAEYFWDAGRFDLALPLLERSAGYNTHSNLSLSSGAALALYKRDFDRSARAQMEIARRYSDLGALSEYFELIFALGRADEAWKIYEEVYRDGNGGKVLHAIAQHSRQIGWSEQRAIDWLATPRNAVLADGTFFYAPRAALAAAIVDREPVNDLAAIVQRFAAPSPYVLDKAGGKILRRGDPTRPVTQKPEVCGPSRYGKGPVGGMGKIDRADSSLVYFAQGYQALARNQHAEAFRQLDTAARLFEAYDAQCEAVSYLLPYLALAAAHTRNSAALSAYMAEVKYRDRNVNYNLVLAVLAAFEGRHAEAEKRLEQALNRWTTGRFQTLPAAYIYADVLERMYLHTKHPGYRDRLVRWAKIQQRVSPTDAWPFAKEYRYSSVDADRKAALGMALYLDPGSATLKGVSEAEAAAARTLFNEINPFKSQRKKAVAFNQCRQVSPTAADRRGERHFLRTEPG